MFANPPETEWHSLQSYFSWFKTPGFKTKKTWDSYYCWWFRNPANQLRLVVYPIIYRVLYIPRGAGFQLSTVLPRFFSKQKLVPDSAALKFSPPCQLHYTGKASGWWCSEVVSGRNWPYGTDMAEGVSFLGLWLWLRFPGTCLYAYASLERCIKQENNSPRKYWKLTCPPKKGPFQKDMSSSNHWFSGDMLVFLGSMLLSSNNVLTSSCSIRTFVKIGPFSWFGAD